jgi:hypothetical protein
VSHWEAFVDEVANELETWPGIRIEQRDRGLFAVRYEHSELGLLYRDRGLVELPFQGAEHDELINHGYAEAAETTPESTGVSHTLHGPRDVTEVLELFDRRYRGVRGDDEPYSAEDPA